MELNSLKLKEKTVSRSINYQLKRRDIVYADAPLTIYPKQRNGSDMVVAIIIGGAVIYFSRSEIVMLAKLIINASLGIPIFKQEDLHPCYDKSFIVDTNACFQVIEALMSITNKRYAIAQYIRENGKNPTLFELCIVAINAHDCKPHK